MNRLNATLRARLRLESEPDRGSALLGAMLFAVIIAGMAAVLLSIIVSAVYPATLAQARGRTVYNAEAGLQSALGILRAAKTSPATIDAKTGSYLGDRTKLPCSISGTVDGITGSDELYEVELRYYDADHNPSGQTDAWRAANDLPCPMGPSSTQPYFALIEATGSTGAVASSGDAGDRRLSAIYEFTVSNERILGGRIWSYGTAKYCLEASAVPPASGEPSTPITIKYIPAANCTPTDARNQVQLWEYTTDWRIKLSSTVAEDGTGGYCITAPNTTPTTITSEVRGAASAVTYGGKSYTGTAPDRVRIGSGTDRSYSSVTNAQVAWDNPWTVRFTGNSTWYAPTSTSPPSTVVTPNNGVLTATPTTFTYTTTYTDTYKIGSQTRTISRTASYTQSAYTTTTPSTITTYAAELHPCVARTTSYGWGQVFAWTGEATWFGLVDAGTPGAVSTTGTTGACLWSGVYSSTASEAGWTPSILMVGKPTKVTTGAEASQERCASQVYWGSFNPEPAVGAGRATPNFVDGQANPITKQIVNFKEFGRCADVTGANINNADSVGEFNIVYPCKQDPITTTNMAWNHKWYYNPPTVGYTKTSAIWVNSQPNGSGTNYCLQTPDPATSVKYPIFTACGVTNPTTTLPTQARLQWTRYEYTGVYSRSYIFVDQWNRCLTADSVDVYTGGGQPWSKMTVAACNGSEAQKWNAPAYLTDASFGDYREITG